VVLDAKAMDWAAQNGIDTAKLKAAKIPIYGKWYYPEIPAGVPLVNLKTGQIQTFGPGLRAGEVLYARRDDLRSARLGPYAALPEPKPATPPAEAAVAESAGTATAEVTAQAPAPETPVSAAPPTAEVAQAPPGPPPSPREVIVADEPLREGEEIHLPGGSIFPLVFGVGLAVAMLGLVAGPVEVRVIIAALGLVYLLTGAIGWTRQIYRETRAHDLSAEQGAEHGPAAAE
jgi:hypothetical protein